MTSKLINLEDVAALFEDGMTIGVGGWGSRRKPMALVDALLRSGAKDLRIVSFGGPDVGMLCASSQAKSVSHAFVSLDTIAVDPFFAAARENGTIENDELDEAMLVAGLRAAGRNLPFEVTRAGLDSDAVLKNPALKTVVSPYEDGEELLAMPAIRPDISLIHLNRADELGNGQSLGPDPYLDDLLALASERVILSVEEVVSTSELTASHPLSTLLLNRSNVTHVVHAPGGAGFTSCLPDYERDEAWQKRYVAAAKEPQGWQRYHAETAPSRQVG